LILPHYSAQIISACFKLHNFIIDNKNENESEEEFFSNNEFDEINEENAEDMTLDNNFLNNETIQNVFRAFRNANNLA